MPKHKRHQVDLYLLTFSLFTVLFTLTGCQSATKYRLDADKAAANIIQEKQIQALGKAEAFSIERPSDTLRGRLLIEQNLPYFGKASLGADKLKAIEHWPEKNYPAANPSPDRMLLPEADQPLKISLMQALQIGARNNFEYQTRKEDVFRAALELDLERNEFRHTFAGKIESLYESDSTGKDAVRGTQNSAAFDSTKTLKTGATFTTALAVDLVNLLTLGGASSLGIVADATISIPLLRGSRRHIVLEPLTQAERNVVYAIWEFGRFKKILAVNIAKAYLEVLKQLSEVENAAQNYRNLITSTRRTRKMADAGRVSEIQVDQSVQNELRAHNRWISTQESYKNGLDILKRSIGLPPDAEIVLDKSDLDRLIALTSNIMADITTEKPLNSGKGPGPPDAPIELVKPGGEDAGPLEIDSSLAIALALENRLDLRVAEGNVYDSQRKVVVAADALRAEVTLFGSAQIGESRSIATADLDNARLRTDKGIYSALLTIDLPFERTAERNVYRNSYIALEKSVREAQIVEDDIKLSVRRKLRDMYEARESRRIQAMAQLVAEKRVRSTTLFFEAGRIPIRDVLEAQEALINAKNGFTSAVVNYRIAELEFQRDTGLLQIDEKGLWQEYQPETGGLEDVREK
ncbi:MAG: TolC family protein [Deltaproteobacteria bacterium]|nr:MAG: TolC family protein [Deltaproteobacteria bacterium]